MSVIGLAILLGIAAANEKSTIAQNQPAGQIMLAPRPQNRVPDNDILVVGNRRDKYKKITEFAESVTKDLDFNNPLARYTSPICLDVSGLKLEQNQQIRKSILFNIELLKIAHGEQHCHVNASVFFVDSPNAIMRSIFKKSPMLFGPLEYDEITKKLKENGKSISIQNIIMRGVDGDKIVGRAVPSRSASLIDLPIRKDIESSIVLVDRASVVGYDIDQISGFLTFRILANIMVPSSIFGNSILEMFNTGPSAAPKKMTEWDLSYLKEVYSGSGNLRGVRKFGKITRRILLEDK